MMKVVTWNIRGLGNPIKSQVVKGLIRSEKPQVLFLQETKLKEEEMSV